MDTRFALASGAKGLTALTVMSLIEDGYRYGLGFWLHPSSDVVLLEGSDAGVSFQTAHDPLSTSTFTVISNTSEGAWPIAELLAERLA